jgi:hypothetical protein
MYKWTEEDFEAPMDANFKDFVECHEGMFDASNDDCMKFLRYVFMAGAFEALMTLRNGVTEGDEGAERYQAYSLEDLLAEAAKAVGMSDDSDKEDDDDNIGLGDNEPQPKHH